MPPRVRRATVHVLGRRVVKTFTDPAAAEREVQWYQRVPWAAPRLLDFKNGDTLFLQFLPPARRTPTWRPVEPLYELLQALHREGIHHRDVHPGNIVRGPAGPLLIDWETALHQPSQVSYDLYGPDDSGVPVPDIHAGMAPQWWGSHQRMSIRNQWRCDVPAPEAQRS